MSESNKPSPADQEEVLGDAGEASSVALDNGAE